MSNESAEVATPSQPKEAFVLGMDRLDDMHPSFFIGLGGSGGRVVDVLATRLRAEPHWDRYRDLIQFISIDTDEADLEDLSKRGHMVSNISVAEKPARIQSARGQTPGIPRDERVAGWVHDWYSFRAASAKGAGQIRLESRFSLYAQLRDQGVGNVRSLLEERISIALRARNPNSGPRPVVRFFFYGSLAGGTGSGANLTLAYLCRRLARKAGVPDNGIEVYGTFFLPSLFRISVGPQLVDSVNANGYAALKEIEHFMELRYANAPASGGLPKTEEYVHDPRAASGSEVTDDDRVATPPFSWVYLVDQPEGKTIDPRQVYRTVGEIALLQLFSPILRKQSSANDNFQKLQMEPRNGYFAVQYGSVGAAVVEFPRTALVNYCARKLTVLALERLVVGRGSDATAKKSAARTADPNFRELSETQQNRLLDLDFVDFIEQEAKREATARRIGMFTQIASMSPSEERSLQVEFKRQLTRWYEETKNAIDIADVDGPSLSEENPTVDGFHRNLIRDFKTASGVLAKKVDEIEHALADEEVFGKLFDGVSPLMQRYFLTRLNQAGAEISGKISADLADDKERIKALQWCILPGDNDDDDSYLTLAHPLMDRALFDPEMEEIRKRVQTANRNMQESLGKILAGRRERAFGEARISVMTQFNNDLVPLIKDALLRQFWHSLTALLRKEIGRRLDLFRNTAKAALGAVSRLKAQAESSRETGIPLPPIRDSFDTKSTPGGHGTEASFHLGTEVFCDPRSGLRHWDAVFELRVLNGFELEPNVLAERINTAVQAATESHRGNQSTLAGGTVLKEILASLDEDLRTRVGQYFAADATGFDLLGGLELEARIVAAQRLGHLTAANVDGVKADAVSTYIEDKIKYARGMSLPLGRIDRALVAGAALAPYEPRFYGMPQMKGKGGKIGPGAEPEKVRAAIGRGVSGFEAIEGWETPDVLTIFQGVLGLPLYAWEDVTSELKNSYQHECKRNAPTPLHTDQRYEMTGFHGQTGLGLPNLGIVDRAAWEARRVAEAERLRRESLLPAIIKLMAAGMVVEEPAGFAIDYDGERTELGKGLDLALKSLCERLSDPVVASSFLESAGNPANDRYDQVERTLTKTITKSTISGRSDDVAAAKMLKAALPQARAL